MNPAKDMAKNVLALAEQVYDKTCFDKYPDALLRNFVMAAKTLAFLTLAPAPIAPPIPAVEDDLPLLAYARQSSTAHSNDTTGKIK
jgi:hypothetical protein